MKLDVVAAIIIMIFFTGFVLSKFYSASEDEKNKAEDAVEHSVTWNEID